MRGTFVVAAVALVVAGAECKRINGAYCDDARPCPNGFACDLVARQCNSTTVIGGDMAGGSTDMAGCACSGATPICVAMTCVSCLSTSDPEGACAAATPSAPHCETTGGDTGACVGCRDANDCAEPTAFCDATTHSCRGCVADAECPSLICDLTPDSTTHGTCIAASNVIYADGSVAADGNGLTPQTARKKIQDAANQAVGLTPARLYVHVATGSYNENIGVNGGKSLYFVGANGAVIHPNAGDALGAQGGGTLTVRNLTASATNGNGGNCNGGSTFNAYQTQFLANAQLGVYTNTCTVLLDGCTVSGNLQGGMTVNGDFKVINSVFAGNKGGPGFTQASIGTNMVFTNNTVADNSSGGTNVGVSCQPATTLILLNTILYNNKGGGGVLSETNCTAAFTATDDVSSGPQSTVDLTMQAPGFIGTTYRLAAGSPCINEGTHTDPSVPDHDIDFEPRPDAKSMIVDIGADEVQ